MARTGALLARCLAACATFALGSCLSDPLGVGSVTLVVEGTTADSAWVGLPGADTLVRVRLYDLEGQPVSGALVDWSPSGTGANISTGMARTDAQGYAVARWRIGTDASERQELRITARRGSAMHETVLRGRLEPAVVATLRFRGELPVIVRLGDTLRLDVAAVDLFGNEFPATEFTVALADSLVGAVLDSARVVGLRRGRSALRVMSGMASTDVLLDVVQRVAAIAVDVDTLRFTSLRAELPVSYVVRDDRGGVISDTAPVVTALDTMVVRWVGDRVRADAPGATELRLTLGSVVTRVPVAVQQRIHSLRLIRDTVHFDALSDTTTLLPIAFDSLGSAIRDPQLEYAVSDDSVARVGGPTIEAVRPGATLVTARDPLTGIEASLEVVVRQRVAAIHMPGTALEFDALGDSAIVVATAHDRLGSLVSGMVFEYVIADSSVAGLDSGTNRVLARAPGLTTVTVREPESGIAATRPINVEQIATTLAVSVQFAGAVITLPEGATLPLECAAVDRNGFALANAPVMVRTVRGTATAAACADVRVERSGYDTLVFALGSLETRVPVIVSTGDSIAVLASARPIPTDERLRFVGEDLNHPSILALRPLVAEILAAYGNPTSNLDRARAIRDWVARTAIYPDSWVRPDTTTSNLSVLPPGKTWLDVNRLLTLDRWNADVAYWQQFYADGYRILDRLLGTLDQATGLRANDGMMEHVAGARYRIRDVNSYRYLACSFQSFIVNALWAAAGLHGTLISVLNHDASGVFIPELGRWVYEDPTYNEEYLLDGAGEPLSPLDLLAISSAGQSGRLRSVKMQGPDFDRGVYPSTISYTDRAMHPEGMIIIGAGLYRRWVGNTGFPMRFVHVDVPALRSVPAPWGDPTLYAPAPAEVAFPMLGPVIAEVRMEDSVAVVRLASTFPDHQRFERRVGGQGWETAGETDVLPVGYYRVEYRSIDAVGSVSGTAVLDVWVPRADSFVREAPVGSLRSLASLYVSSPIQ